MIAGSVLFDAPGPRARARNRLIGILAVLVVLIILGYVLWRFYVTGQFEAKKWSLFSFEAVQIRLLGGLANTLIGFVLGALGSILLGLFLARARMSSYRWLSLPAGWLTDLLRSTPVLLFMMLIYYGLPSVGIKWVTPLMAVVVGLSLYNGSVMAEIFRSGVNALPKGQREAALALGLTPARALNLILLPQAIRHMAPALVAQLVVVLKDTALGFIVTYQELLYLANFYGSQVAYDIPIIPTIMVVGVVYVSLCLGIAGVAKLVEGRLNRSQKLRGSGPSP